MKLLPSIASSNPLCYGHTLEALADWPYLHVDIEDGCFTPNLTFGLKTVRALCKSLEKTIDVHLMVSHPCKWLEQLQGLPIKAVCAHLEALPYPLVFLQYAQRLGFQAGLALNFRSPFSSVEIYLEAADYLLLMTSEPDGDDETLFSPAFKRALGILDRCERPIVIDGGIGEDQLNVLATHGAYATVLGRSVFQQGHPLDNLKRFSNLLEGR